MRCIFCRLPSDQSRSIEHIIPESLGNTSHVLPRGVVCDSCNNYFAHQVEKPFLELPAIEVLRFDQAIESKKGRLPLVTGIIPPDLSVRVTRKLKLNTTLVDVPLAARNRVASMKEGKLYLPRSLPLPIGPTVSRFLAKVGVEAMAQRFLSYPGGLDDVCDEGQLDAARDHARRGKILNWPVYTRRIYDADGTTFGPDGSRVHVVHEYDLLATPANEIYFVLALFGQEFTINMGGPDIEGYVEWLKANNYGSPLYVGKNASTYPKRIVDPR